MACAVSCTILLFLGILWQASATINSSVLGVILGTLGVVPSNCYQFCHTMTFILVFGELTAALASWAYCLTQEARSLKRSLEQSGNNGKQAEHLTNFLARSQALTKALRSSTVFGPHLFILSNLFMFGVVSGGYRSVSFFIGIHGQDGKLGDWAFWTMVIGYVGNTSLMFSVLVLLAMPAYEVEKQVGELMFALSALTGWDLPAEDSANLSEILEQLRAFKGFSALDYFYINRTFLSSIVSTFITYMIILLQFRVGEKQT